MESTSPQPLPTSPRFKDLTGKPFDHLKVLYYAGQTRTSGGNVIHLWRCVCKYKGCGNETTVRGGDLRSGLTGSCGCLRKEVTGNRSRTHGKSHSVEHKIWKGIVKRCYNENAAGYARYGGRGIEVSARWQGPGGFANFLADMGKRPTPKHSIDRYPDNNGNYEPSNCRWATFKEQQRNRRTNKLLTMNGETRCMEEWVEITGLPRSTLDCRLKRGWSVEKALTTPLRGS